jgi:hypothetical protein
MFVDETEGSEGRNDFEIDMDGLSVNVFRGGYDLTKLEYLMRCDWCGSETIQ